MNVELHIERLILNGVPLPPGGRDALAGTFGRELTRLIQDGGVSPALLGGISSPRLTATLGPAGPLGTELARSVYSCLGTGLIRR